MSNIQSLMYENTHKISTNRKGAFILFSSFKYFFVIIIYFLLNTYINVSITAILANKTNNTECTEF